MRGGTAYIGALLAPSNVDEFVLEHARAFRMPFGPHRRRALGAMRLETLRRCVRLIERDLSRTPEYAELRRMAQIYLRCSPPSFPRLRSDGLSPNRRRKLRDAHMASLNAFAALPPVNDGDDVFSAVIFDTGVELYPTVACSAVAPYLEQQIGKFAKM